MTTKDLPQRQKVIIRFMRLPLPGIISALLLMYACLNFAHIHPNLIDASASLSNSSTLNRQSFFVTFYVFTGFCTVFLVLSYILRSQTYRVLTIVLSFVFIVLGIYAVPDFFTVKIYLYSAWIITAIMLPEIPLNMIIGFAGTCTAAFFLLFPNVLGIDIISHIIKTDTKIERYTYPVYLFGILILMASLRYAMEKWNESMDTLLHLHTIMTQMSILNHKLQKAAKKWREDAAEEERLRISRDMHDSLGYVFTNIIALMDGAVSSNGENWKQLQEICQIVRDQAKNGLTETRKTLHAIRNIKEPLFRSIDTIYQLKKIFEEVTGIHIVIEIGNIKQNYGLTVNTVLVRALQEAFTNSVRHGRATHIEIQFWEFPDYLSMTVTDNGIGSKKIVKGIGLAGMEERLMKVGGTLETLSPVEGGFRLVITIPLSQTEDIYADNT